LLNGRYLILNNFGLDQIPATKAEKFKKFKDKEKKDEKINFDDILNFFFM